jgi:hypothetical protein
MDMLSFTAEKEVKELHTFVLISGIKKRSGTKRIFSEMKYGFSNHKRFELRLVSRRF